MHEFMICIKYHWHAHTQASSMANHHPPPTPTPIHSPPNYAYFFMKFWLNDIRLCARLRTMMAGWREAPAAIIGRKRAHNRMSLSNQAGQPHTLKGPIVNRPIPPIRASRSANEPLAHYPPLPLFAIDPLCTISARRLRVACLSCCDPIATMHQNSMPKIDIEKKKENFFLI